MLVVSGRRPVQHAVKNDRIGLPLQDELQAGENHLSLLYSGNPPALVVAEQARASWVVVNNRDEGLATTLIGP